MKKQTFKDMCALLLSPVLMILLGLLLLVHPDSASALVGKVLGWVLLLLGLGCGISAIAKPAGTAVKVIPALILLCLGIWLIRTPLALANYGGLFIGILLAIRGIQELAAGRDKLWSLITLLLGVVLVLSPMTTSRLLFGIIGGIVTVVGLAMLLDRLRRRRLERGDDDPNIIDAL